MNYTIMFFGLSLWISIGMSIGFLIDAIEMRKDIPYKQMPAMLPLRTLRVLVIAVSTIMTVPMIVKAVVDAFVEFVYLFFMFIVFLVKGSRR